MSRHRILRRVREALEAREGVGHPGPFGSWRQEGVAHPGDADRTEGFRDAFEAAGGEVLHAADRDDARDHLRHLVGEAAGLCAGAGVPADLLPDLPRMEPREAPVGVSVARGAVAETGSLLMDARDGRRSQLLPPVHVVLVARATIHATLSQALSAVRDDLSSGLALHSGPSKSADIGQVLVRGVHGPGRVVAVVVDEPV